MSQDQKPTSRRPVLKGLDAKALLAAGLEDIETPKPAPPPPPSSSPSRYSKLFLLFVSGGILFAALIMWFFSAPPQSPEWTNLIATTDPATALHRGDWEKSAGSLTSLHDAQSALLAIPVKNLGTSYDIRVALTRLGGTQSIALFFRTTQGMGALEFDAWEHPGLSGVQMFDGQDLRSQGSFHFPLVNGQNYEFLLQVRPNVIHVYHQDKLLQTYPLTGRHLEITPPWDWSGDWTNTHLTLASWRSPTRFTKLEVKQVR